MRPFGRSTCTTCSAGFCTVVLATTTVVTAGLAAGFSSGLSVALLSLLVVEDAVCVAGELEDVVVVPDELLPLDELLLVVLPLLVDVLLALLAFSDELLTLGELLISATVGVGATTVSCGLLGATVGALCAAAVLAAAAASAVAFAAADAASAAAWAAT
jgi:hypothetical protein